jgi:3-dehydroquinate synthase
MKKISVNASRNYEVIMGRGLLKNAAAYIKEAFGRNPAGMKLCIVTDETVGGLYGGSDHALHQSLEQAGFEVHTYVFPGGEENKNMSTIADILNYLADNRFSRSDALIALGGGITGDVTGFAAASFLRGVEFIQIPTSLLAVVDSSVGGKTGVNLNAGKNLAGAFWQPSAVLFDPDVLNTLSYDLKLDGIAEAVKAGIIGDPGIITAVSGDIPADDAGFLTDLAAMAVEVKRKVVEEDERESGVRQLLNLGHTPAHAIEKCSSYSIRHGHAVAMGIAIVATAAAAMGWTSAECRDDIISILKRFGFQLGCPYSPAQLAEAAFRDKKVRGSSITLVIPEAHGKCTLKTIPTDELERFFTLGLEQK